LKDNQKVKENQDENQEEVVFEKTEEIETEMIDDSEAESRPIVETPEHLDTKAHFYCLQMKYKQGSKEDEIIINKAAMMAGKAMKEQTGCDDGIDTMIMENTFAIATAIASKNENFFAKALYCKYEKYPIGIMLGDYNQLLKIAISPTIYIEKKYRTEELMDKLKGTFKYWAVNTKKANKALIETLQVI
jgi:hypothetical protein